jgi:hypothetical protein
MNLFEQVKSPRLLQNDTLLLMLQALALFFIIAGVRFAIVWQYGSDLPYWDQWGTEGQELIKRYFDGTLDLKHWFAPSNEHRVFFTRVIALALTLLNDQWDARVEMLVNAVICALAASGLYYVVAGGLKNHFQRWIWYAVVAVVFTFPFGWENTIAGFQSQFYLLALFSIASIALLGNYHAFSWQWIVGSLLLPCTLFTMASGLLASIVVVFLLTVILVRERNDWKSVLKRDLPTYLACAVIATAGILLTVRLEAHAKYESHSIGQFLEALMISLSWPNIGHIWWSFISWLPFFGLLTAYITGFSKNGRNERLALGFGLWIILQSAATAYSRAAIIYSSRYFDIYSYGLLVNFICILILLQTIRSSWKYAILIPFSLIWLAVNGSNLYELSFNGALGGRKMIYDVEAANTGAYLATGNFNFLIPKQDKKEIPYNNPEGYAQLLNDPVISTILPGSVRSPLPLTPVFGSWRPGYNPLGILELPLHPGQRIWVASSAPQGMPFEAVAKKSAGLPYVAFYLIGDLEKIVVKDADKHSHRLKMLPLGGVSGSDGVWQPVYAYCPGTECHISGVTADNVSVTFSEPREMGRWSLWGLHAAFAGTKLFWAGMAFTVVAIIWWALGVIATRKMSSQGRLSCSESKRNAND